MTIKEEKAWVKNLLASHPKKAEQLLIEADAAYREYHAKMQAINRRSERVFKRNPFRLRFMEITHIPDEFDMWQPECFQPLYYDPAKNYAVRVYLEETPWRAELLERANAMKATTAD